LIGYLVETKSVLYLRDGTALEINTNQRFRHSIRHLNKHSQRTVSHRITFHNRESEADSMFKCKLRAVRIVRPGAESA